MDDLLQTLVSADDQDVRALSSQVARLPEPRREAILSTLLRVLITYERSKDPSLLTQLLDSLRLSLKLHAGDSGYAAALDRAARQGHGRPLSRDEVAALLARE